MNPPFGIVEPQAFYFRYGVSKGGNGCGAGVEPARGLKECWGVRIEAR